MGSEGLQQTFEALLNSLAIAESSLEKCVHQSCALPGHPAAQVLYFRFSIFFFLPSETGCKAHLQFSPPRVSVSGASRVSGFG